MLFIERGIVKITVLKGDRMIWSTITTFFSKFNKKKKEAVSTMADEGSDRSDSVQEQETLVNQEEKRLAQDGLVYRQLNLFYLY